MSDHTTVTFGLAFLVPIGYALIAASGLPIERARQAAISFFAALGLATIGYVATGFALQFGGIGLVYDRPGFEGLIWEWSLLGPTWGPGWGMAGLAGWGLTGAAATSAARALALANLPWVITAAADSVDRAARTHPGAGLQVCSGLLTGALLYPLAGNWLWGGGWLGNLGGNLGFGHGLVDAGGASLVHLLGAAAALAGLLAFLPRRAEAADPHAPVPLPAAHLPLLALLGAGSLLVGVTAWLTANPLLDRAALDLPRDAAQRRVGCRRGRFVAAGLYLAGGRPARSLDGGPRPGRGCCRQPGGRALRGALGRIGCRPHHGPADALRRLLRGPHPALGRSDRSTGRPWAGRGTGSAGRWPLGRWHGWHRLEHRRRRRIPGRSPPGRDRLVGCRRLPAGLARARCRRNWWAWPRWRCSASSPPGCAWRLLRASCTCCGLGPQRPKSLLPRPNSSR